MKHIKTFLGSAALLAILAGAPIAASAEVSAESRSRIFIAPSGFVHVIGAKVTSVSDSAINAVTSFGNTALNWIINISTDTKVKVEGQTASSTALKSGDTIGFTGRLSSTTSLTAGGEALTVSAANVRTSKPRLHGWRNRVEDDDSASTTSKHRFSRGRGLGLGLGLFGHLRLGDTDR